MMHRLSTALAIACFASLWYLIDGQSSHGVENELWYDQPAAQWTEALPIGNGRMGAMVFGGVEEARYQFNEDTLWTGQPQDYAHQGAAEHLAEIRRLLLEGKQEQAERLAMEHFMSAPIRQTAYQPFGDVEVSFHTPSAVVGSYRRSLDLDTATATTTYEIGGVVYTRRSFASYPNRAIILHYTCDQPASLAFSAVLTSPQAGVETSAVDDRTLLIKGQVGDLKDPRYRGLPSAMSFAAHLRVLSTDGDVAVADGRLTVTGASTATLAVTAATNFVNYKDLSADPVQRSEKDLNSVSSKTYEELFAAHTLDHQSLYRRVQLELRSADEAVQDLPTDQRILKYADRPDPRLATLLFNYGRYLLIASSRPGCQPANLQGLWNDQLAPPWESKYTVNINAEMNYWPTEPCNLAECGEPLLAAVRDLSEAGKSTARAHYNARGWVLHHNFDLWRGTAPINASNHGIWPTGGAWLCEHLWQRYVYGGDKEYLRHTAYPIMKGASEFFADFLILDPRDPERQLISGPSNSPEQGGLVMGPTMDHQIIRSLFANTVEASEALGVDEEFASELAELSDRIAPNQIGKHGQLQEWLEDTDDLNNRHRHVSHLWGLHPGNEITPDTPELFAAARRSLEIRGDGGTGWSLAWKINLWARLRDGGHAHRMLGRLLTLTGSARTDYRGGGVYANLFDAHPPFQIDGNFGATNGICEMLVQSHRRNENGDWIVELLPALPSAWPEGSVSGIRTRGGLEVSMKWKDGRVTEAVLVAPRGGKCELKLGDVSMEILLGPMELRVLDFSS